MQRWRTVSRSVRTSVCRALWAVALIWVAAEPASTQTLAQDPAESARVRLGRFAFTPAVWSTAGYDSNVEGESEEPKGDYIVVVVPQLETWLDLGRARLSTLGVYEFFTYQELEPTKTFVHFNSVSFSVPGVRFEPEAFYSHRNTYARPTGFEVGARSRRIEDEVSAGINWDMTARMGLSARARYLDIDYDASAEYQGSNLRESLNRRTSSGIFGVSRELTPLTSMSVSLDVTADRFVYSPERDGDSVRLYGGVSFLSPALFTGSAMLGYRRFESPYSADLNFEGVVAAVQLMYARESRTMFDIQLYREPFFSYAESLGYYWMNSAAAGVVQALSEKWEARVFGAYRFLDYVQNSPESQNAGNTIRTDVGGGLSWRMGPFTRFGMNYEYTVSTGATAFREWRLVGYIVYGTDRLKRLENPIPDERRY